MKNADLKNLITDDSTLQWTQSETITINYPHINFNITFTGIPALYKFILQQIEGWGKYEKLPQKFTEVKSRFENYKIEIVNFINDQRTRNKNNWRRVKTSIEQGNPPMFVYDCPEVEFLSSIFNTMGTRTFTSAYNYITNDSRSQNFNLNNRDQINGILLAYEFRLKEATGIKKRRTAEKISLTHLKNDFRKYLSTSEKELTDHLQEAENKRKEFSDFIDELRETKNTEISEWFDQNKTEINDFIEDSKKSMESMKKLYNEKLRLSAPAQFWNNRAQSLRNQARWWLGGAVVALAIGIALLFTTINRLQLAKLEEIFNDTGQAIKWSILFLVLISFLAYGIRIFTKLTFSSFHLARDAEEREQLTHVYLSLANEKNIDKTERQLIMQALFSRAESGLLSDDGSPSMPGNILSQVLSNGQGK